MKLLDILTIGARNEGKRFKCFNDIVYVFRKGEFRYESGYAPVRFTPDEALSDGWHFIDPMNESAVVISEPGPVSREAWDSLRALPD